MHASLIISYTCVAKMHYTVKVSSVMYPIGNAVPETEEASEGRNRLTNSLLFSQGSHRHEYPGISARTMVSGLESFSLRLTPQRNYIVLTNVGTKALFFQTNIC